MNINSNSNNILNYLPENQPSLFIQWSDKSITSDSVKNVIDELNLGIIDHIDSRPTLNQKNKIKGNIFYIHFVEWFRNPISDKVREKLISNPSEFIKVHYEPNKYWKIFANKYQPIVPLFKPMITFNDEEDKEYKEHKEHEIKQIQKKQYKEKHHNRQRFIPKSKPIPDSDVDANINTNTNTNENINSYAKKYKWRNDESDDES
jgi:hypothetical protein